MRESFIFYRSFYEAIKDLDDKKRLKMYDSIANLALNLEENTNLRGICQQLFVLIKPQILANNKRFEDGTKGGRPKKNKTTGFSEKKPNNNVNENNNVNVNNNENENNLVFCEENLNKPISKKRDFLLNPQIDKCIEIYKKNCTDLIPLGFERRNTSVLEKLDNVMNVFNDDLNQFETLCKKANELKIIASSRIDFEKMLNCYTGILNGKYKVVEISSVQEEPCISAKTEMERISDKILEKIKLEEAEKIKEGKVYK